MTGSGLGGRTTGTLAFDAGGSGTGLVSVPAPGAETGAGTGAGTGDDGGDSGGVAAGGVIGAVAGFVAGAVTGAVTGDVTGDVTGIVAGTVVGGMAGGVAGVAGEGSGAGAAGGASVTTPTEGRDDGRVCWDSATTARPTGGFRKKFATPAHSASNSTLIMAIFNQRLGVGACSARALQALGKSGVTCKAAEIFRLQKV